MTQIGLLWVLLLGGVILVRRPFARGNLLLSAILLLDGLGAIAPLLAPRPWLLA